jgi:hypothetical protein
LCGTISFQPYRGVVRLREVPRRRRSEQKFPGLGPAAARARRLELPPATRRARRGRGHARALVRARAARAAARARRWRCPTAQSASPIFPRASRELEARPRRPAKSLQRNGIRPDERSAWQTNGGERRAEMRSTASAESWRGHLRAVEGECWRSAIASGSSRIPRLVASAHALVAQARAPRPRRGKSAPGKALDIRAQISAPIFPG